MLADLKKFQNADVDYAFCDTHVDTVFRERERERERGGVSGSGNNWVESKFMVVSESSRVGKREDILFCGS